MKITLILLFLIQISCSNLSIREEFDKGYDSVSCRIECREEGKIGVLNNNKCICSEEKKATIDQLLEKMDKLAESLKKEPICERKETVEVKVLSHVEEKKEIKKNKDHDPLRDIIEN